MVLRHWCGTMRSGHGIDNAKKTDSALPYTSLQFSSTEMLIHLLFSITTPLPPPMKLACVPGWSWLHSCLKRRKVDFCTPANPLMTNPPLLFSTYLHAYNKKHAFTCKNCKPWHINDFFHEMPFSLHFLLWCFWNEMCNDFLNLGYKILSTITKVEES